MSPTETVTISMSLQPTPPPGRLADVSPSDPGAPGQPQRALTIPRQLGPVKLLSELGRGGMGVVWLGEHELLRRQVAVKFMLNAVEADDPGFKMFLDGARAAAAVRHLGLTAVLHADLVEGVPYLVMEYVDGPSLSDVLAETGPFPTAACVAIMLQVADAVANLHDHSIVHRDIKPSNILLDGSGKPYVTDFGLSCVRQQGDEGDTSRVIGTPAYMSPELREGRASARSDVFAMGVTMYQLLTEELPDITGITLGAPMTIGEPALDRLRRAGVGEALVEVIGRATNDNPVYRFKSARFLHRALSEIPTVSGDGTTHVAKLMRRMHPAGNAASEPTPAERETSFDRASKSVADAVARLVESKRRVTGRTPTDDTPLAVTPPPLPPTPPSRADRPAMATSDRDERLLEAVVCTSCGFDLRWQRWDAKCPECGLEVARSVSGELLRYQNGEWLRKIVSALAWHALGLRLLVATSILPLVTRAWRADDLETLGTWVLMSSMVGLAALVLVMITAWWLAAPIPRAADKGDPIVRSLIRPALLGLIMGVSTAPLLIASRASDVARTSYFLCSAVLGIALYALVAGHLVWLCRRIPDRRLADRVRYELTLCTIAAAAGIVGWLVDDQFRFTAHLPAALALLPMLSWMAAALVLAWRIGSFTRSLCATLPADHAVWRWLKGDPL